MNARNLSFVIVLILVWIMGYYYYSPDRSVNAQDIEKPHQEILATMSQRDEPMQALEPEPLSPATPYVAPEKLENEPVSKQIKKKKRTRKEKKKAIAQPQPTAIIVDQKIEPSLQEPAYSSVAPDDQEIGQIVSIVSNLKKKDIGYYKMLSWHYPHFFSLTVNDQPLFFKKDKVITQVDPIMIPRNKPFIIRYSYEWHTPWGKKIGAKKVTFKAQENAPQLTVHFKSNWKDEERIIVDGAEKISVELLEEEVAS